MTLNHSDCCRICGNSSLITILSDIRTKLGEVYSLVQCGECSFVSTHPLPSAEELKKYYDQDYWQRSTKTTGNLLNLFYKLRMSGIINDIKSLVHGKGRILDWGAGDGSLVRLLEKSGSIKAVYFTGPYLGILGV